ncbi:hypothetical protein HATV-3_gp57 [Haloarcula tailed virus 3]|uniref:Uncharacterized protein n=1 Tax=Haloarcula tailed virus 3 TaxID=2877990 RepID=A0AAE8Y067_9CAUD|nr:hypothetical protein M1M35_gp57 [Haloarcula tailed virus 3]UBF23407.1 hypothetical protein HATV-3_gp57 [Haloarcula tailed virus 3]
MIYHTPMSTVGGDKRIYHTDKDCRHLPDDPDGYYSREEPVDGWELCQTCEGTETHTNGDNSLYKKISDPEFTA